MSPARGGRFDGGRQLQRWARLLRALRLERPRPRVGVALGASAPAWALRALQVAVALGCTATVATNGAQWALVSVGLVAMVIRPAPAWQAGFVLAIGAGLMLTPAEPFAPRVFILLLGVHLFVLLGAFLGRMPWSARLELRAFVASARRLAAIQLFGQTLALAAGWLSSRELASAWIAVAAVAVLAAAAWAVSSRLASPAVLWNPPDETDAEREDGWAYRLDA